MRKIILATLLLAGCSNNFEETPAQTEMLRTNFHFDTDQIAELMRKCRAKSKSACESLVRRTKSAAETGRHYCKNVPTDTGCPFNEAQWRDYEAKANALSKEAWLQ